MSTKYLDLNKERRERERRLLHNHGWMAVIALKKNGSKTWRWIKAGRKRAYTREEALKTIGR